MKKIFMVLTMLLAMGVSLMASNGIVNVASDYDVKQTADRLEAVLKKKNMNIFNRIDHAKGAKKVGIELRNTQLIIFGNPKVGSPLMKCQQTVALDLPQKALVWKDKNEKVWISYNDPMYLKQRHNITGCEKVLNKVSNALAKMTQAAASKK